MKSYHGSKNTHRCTTLQKTNLHFLQGKTSLKPHHLSAVFFGKWWSSKGPVLIHSWGFEDLHRPYLCLMGEVFPRGLRIQDLQGFHLGSRLVITV